MLVFLGHAVKLYQIGFITRLDNIIYDYRLRTMPTVPGTNGSRIVILDIDEKSLDRHALGRWPWRRDKIVDLLQKLFDKYGVAIVGFDVVFAEPDESSGLPVLETLAKTKLKDVVPFQSALNELRPQLDYDALFANFLKGRPVVLGYYFSNRDDAVQSGEIPAPVLPAGTFSGRAIDFTRWKGYGGNLREFQENIASAGHINPMVDADGVVRRVPMLAEFEKSYYEPLSLAMVRVLLNYPKVLPGFAPDRFINKGYPGLEWLEVGPLRIPVDENVSALIPYRGPKGSFPYISLSDVWFERVPVEELKGRIALIGTSVPSLADLKSTPVGEVFPGVEVHANMIAGMLDRTIKQKPPYVLGAEVILLLVGWVSLSILVPLLPRWETRVSLLVLVMIVALNFSVWYWADLVLPLAASLLMAVALFGLNMSYGYFIVTRKERAMNELFGQYVPPENVAKMAEDPEKYNMEPRREELTILFCDVRGFTTISERLSSEDLQKYINEYLTAMSVIIRSKYKGTLDKYIGDAIVAFWGAPVDDIDHARNGVLAALDMQRECASLTKDFEKRYGEELKIGVGVNTGEVHVGDMGSAIRRAYTAMGDTMNVASRLEGRTKHYGVGILVGENTKKAVSDVLFREVDKVMLKGKAEPVTIYEPIGLVGSVDEKIADELKLWHQTLRFYRARQWDQAELGILNLQRMNPDSNVYRHYSQVVVAMRRAPPPDGWDGVTVFDEK